MFPAARDDDLRWLVSQSVLAQKFGSDGFAQFRDAAARRVFREPIGQRFRGGILDVLRRVEIRFARAEADHVFTGGLHRLGLGINRQSQ